MTIQYTPDEFRELLTRIYGPATDWDLAGKAAKDFNVDQNTVYRWLKGVHPVTGTAAGLAYRLSKESEK